MDIQQYALHAIAFLEQLSPFYQLMQRCQTLVDRLRLLYFSDLGEGTKNDFGAKFNGTLRHASRG